MILYFMGSVFRLLSYQGSTIADTSPSPSVYHKGGCSHCCHHVFLEHIQIQPGSTLDLFPVNFNPDISISINFPTSKSYDGTNHLNLTSRNTGNWRLPIFTVVLLCSHYIYHTTHFMYIKTINVQCSLSLLTTAEQFWSKYLHPEKKQLRKKQQDAMFVEQNWYTNTT